ncbi:MAG: hypothetical protein ACK48U_24585, partial [Planctomyces sp.]
KQVPSQDEFNTVAVTEATTKPAAAIIPRAADTVDHSSVDSIMEQWDAADWWLAADLTASADPSATADRSRRRI